MPRKRFLAPADTPVDTINRCIRIPASQSWLAAFNAALLDLAQWYNWEQVNDTDLTPEDAAATAFAVWVEYLTSECAADMTCQDVWNCLAPYQPIPAGATVRVNAGVPQFSLDGGTTWSDLNDPGTGGTLRVPSRTVTAGTDKLCLASTRARNAIAEFYKQTAGAVAANLLNTFNSIFNFLNAFTNAAFEAIYSPYDGLLEAVIFDPIEMPTNYSAGELSATAKDDLLCLLLANATDTAGVVSFNYAAILTDMITVLGLNPGTAVSLLLTYVGESGLNRMGDVASTDTANCALCEACASYTDLMQSGLGILTAGAFGPTSPIGVGAGRWSATGWTGTPAWQATQGRTGGGSVNMARHQTDNNHWEGYIAIDLGQECNVTSIEFFIKGYNDGNNTSENGWAAYNAAKVSQGSSWTVSTVGTTYAQRAYSVNMPTVRYIVIGGLIHSNRSGGAIDDITIGVP